MDKHSEKVMKILTDLYDIDGRMIAPAGAYMTPSLIRDVISRGKPLQRKTLSLARPEFLRDVAAALEDPLYEKLFSPPGFKKKIITIARKARMQEHLYHEVHRLKKSSPYTYRHFVLIAVLAAKMAIDLKAYRCKPGEAFVYGLIHDIGKTRLSKNVLNKKERLTSNEYRILHSYPLNSLLLLRYYLGLKGTEACRVAYEHHEALDGSGYPKGIKTMSKYTRIVAMIDIFDALVAERPYRKRSFTVRGALDKLIQGMDAGKYPKLSVRLLISYFRSGSQNFRTMKISRAPREEDPDGNSYGKVDSAA